CLFNAARLSFCTQVITDYYHPLPDIGIFFACIPRAGIPHILNKTIIKISIMNAPTPPYLKSLTECHKKMFEDGYTENFTVEDNRLKCVDCDRTYRPEEVSIKNFFRFEGISDPDDNDIMYAIETVDGKK